MCYLLCRIDVVKLQILSSTTVGALSRIEELLPSFGHPFSLILSFDYCIFVRHGFDTTR